MAGYVCRMAPLVAVKVFSTTMFRDREALGERVTEWLAAHPELKLLDRDVRQSSDEKFHCLTITLFLSGNPDAYLAEPLLPVARSSAPRPVTPR